MFRIYVYCVVPIPEKTTKFIISYKSDSYHLPSANATGEEGRMDVKEYCEFIYDADFPLFTIACVKEDAETKRMDKVDTIFLKVTDLSGVIRIGDHVLSISIRVTKNESKKEKKESKTVPDKAKEARDSGYYSNLTSPEATDRLLHEKDEQIRNLKEYIDRILKVICDTDISILEKIDK